MRIRDDEFLWFQKYRPRNIDDCILPQDVKKNLSAFIQKGEIPNFLFYGPAGCGKTTAALAMCEELKADVLFINASLETSVDNIRNEIKDHASTVSLIDAVKVVILDECDAPSLVQHFQPALRGFIEEFSNNCRFILTCNYKHRIIDPIVSRCAGIDFKIPVQEKAVIATSFFKCMSNILNKEGITFDKQVVAEFVNKYFPDYRHIINELQLYSASGTIDSGIFVNISADSFKKLFRMLKEKNFTEMRKWVTASADGDSARVFREIYDTANLYLDNSSIPQLVLILAEYSYRSAFVADPEINIVACLTEIMSSCKFM